MKKWIKADSLPNIIAHYLVAALFLRFAWQGYVMREGSTNQAYGAGVYTGVMVCLAMALIVDGAMCIKKRREVKP